MLQCRQTQTIADNAVEDTAEQVADRMLTAAREQDCVLALMFHQGRFGTVGKGINARPQSETASPLRAAKPRSP